jgi:uronate dehydrogenase
MRNCIVLTGAAGKLARRLRASLSQQCRELRITDILPLETLRANETVVPCDLSDGEAAARLLQGADAVVHFAGYPREASWDVLVPANLISITNLWEQSLKAGVKRIVYASSNHAIGFHPTERLIGVDAEVKPDSRYGVTKVFAEAMARFYYDKFGIESLGLRIGRCEDKPTDERMLSTWLHPEDMIQLVELGLTRPLKADLIYGVSRNSKAWWVNPDWPEFGYQPRHSADDYVLPPEAAAGPVWRYQGGLFADAEYIGDVERAAALSRR